MTIIQVLCVFFKRCLLWPYQNRWALGKPRAIEPIPVKGKLHLYDVDDALIHYVDGGDLGAYATPEEANAFIDAYIKKFLDPLAYKPKKTRKSKATEEEASRCYARRTQRTPSACSADSFFSSCSCVVIRLFFHLEPFQRISMTTARKSSSSAMAIQRP